MVGLGLFNGDGVSVLQDLKSSGDEWTVWMNLTLLNYTLKIFKVLKFYVMYILPQLNKMGIKNTVAHELTLDNQNSFHWSWESHVTSTCSHLCCLSTAESGQPKEMPVGKRNPCSVGTWLRDIVFDLYKKLRFECDTILQNSRYNNMIYIIVFWGINELQHVNILNGD